LLLARVGAKGELLLLAIQRLEHLVGPQRLEPVGVARVGGGLVEAGGGVAVEDRPAERGPRHAVPVAAARAVPSGEHELELALVARPARVRLAEQGDRAVPERPLSAAVVLDLVVNL